MNVPSYSKAKPFLDEIDFVFHLPEQGRSLWTLTTRGCEIGSFTTWTEAWIAVLKEATHALNRHRYRSAILRAYRIAELPVRAQLREWIRDRFLYDESQLLAMSVAQSSGYVPVNLDSLPRDWRRVFKRILVSEYAGTKIPPDFFAQFDRIDRKIAAGRNRRVADRGRQFFPDTSTETIACSRSTAGSECVRRARG